jgi:superfamily II DNA/RNA helicase
MNLKKINEGLKESLIANGLVEANELQKETFSAIKSGADCLILSPAGSGKTTTIVLNVIQQLVKEGEQSPRALIVVEDKEQVLKMVALFEKLGNHTDLTVFGVHDKGDMDYDKNYISGGIDVLIGTPKKLSEMFSTAGFNVNRLKMFIVDDADPLLKLRHEPKIMHISNSITKVQRLIFATHLTERIESLADKMLIEPYEFDFEEYDEEEEFEEDEFEKDEFETDDFEELEGDEENGNK